jgi:hypothetical protein
VGVTDKGRNVEEEASNGWVIMIGCAEADEAGFPPRRCELWK